MEFDAWQTEYRRAFKWPRPITETLAEAGVKIGNKEDVAVQSAAPVEDVSIQTNGDPTAALVDPHRAPFIHDDNEPAPVSEPINTKPDDKVKGKTKLETKERERGKSKRKTAEMLSYGWGNNHPATPQNFMKTFNVTVPKSQIFPSTLERVSRGKSYDARARAADKKPGPPPKSGDYKSIEEAALRNYVEAKKKLAQIQSIYQTEYKREFQNWTESTAHIQIAAGFPSDKKNESDGNVNGGANPLSSPKRNAWGTSNTEKREVSLSPIRATSPIKRGSDLESLQNFSLRDRSVSPIKSQARDAIVSPHKVSPGSDVPFGKSPKKIFKDITLFTEAVPDLPAAGVTEEQAHANKQKRHYPEKKAQLQQLWFDMSKEGFVVDDEKQEAPQEEDHAQDSVKKSPTKEKDADLPASFKQAQDLLNRAHKRSQKLEEELKVENADS